MAGAKRQRAQSTAEHTYDVASPPLPVKAPVSSAAPQQDHSAHDNAPRQPAAPQQAQSVYDNTNDVGESGCTQWAIYDAVGAKPVPGHKPPPTPAYRPPSRARAIYAAIRASAEEEEKSSLYEAIDKAVGADPVCNPVYSTGAAGALYDPVVRVIAAYDGTARVAESVYGDASLPGPSPRESRLQVGALVEELRVLPGRHIQGAPAALRTRTFRRAC